jgi:hypothetical protein
LWERTFGGIHQQQDTVHECQRSLDFAAEIRVTWSVDQVDLDASPLDCCSLGQDGDTAFPLLVVVVHDTFDQRLMRGEGSGLTQQFINQGGFSMVNVRDDCDVANEFVQECDPSSLSAISPSSSNTTP